MSISHDWTDILDERVCEAIRAGRVEGELSGVPDAVMESGLAHIFFYGNVVYKLYKTHADKDHFIKGVLAPTNRRIAFLEHDYTLNQHFSSDVYLNRYSLQYDNGIVRVLPYNRGSIYVLVEMNRLDFTHNLHERLLRNEISFKELYELGYETARAIATCPITAPDDVNWYDLATARIALLKQFVDWLPEEFGMPVRQARVIDALEKHLARNEEEYRAITGRALAVNVDNHDENIFFVGGRPQFIDLLPPMDSWWFGLPYANLSNVMANVEALYSDTAAAEVKRGYLEYHEHEPIPEHIFGFTRAFAYLISIAHFGSVPEKGEVTKKYLARLKDIPNWL